MPAGDNRQEYGLPRADLLAIGRVDVKTKDGAVLLCGSRSRSSRVEVFPASSICPETGAHDMESVEFGPDGILYSFSTVHVSSTRAVPYTIGYVDFPTGLRVLAHIRGESKLLGCGVPVRLAAEGQQWWVEPKGQSN